MLPNLSTLATLALGAASLVSAQYPITGVGSVAVRKNINDLQSQGGPAWDLYIRAMNDIQNNRNINDPFSFFQVAGIHGKPYIEWDGSGAGDSDGWQGYCPHGERLFLTWHRPYVVLFEQILVATAQRLAREYPSNVRNSYISAANSLRSPYWDWALQQGVPQATVPQQVTVTAPNSRGTGTQRITIKNPLYSFTFPSGTFNTNNFGDMTYNGQRLTRTYRCNARGQSYPNTANQQLGQRTYKQWVYDAFTSSNTFDQFASTAANNGVSLEQIHNAIHWDAGCGGQFLTADYSGFDPIFMLHHTNVDRMWAYWQSIHPDQAVFTSSYSGGARWSTPQGTTISPSSPLAPFYMDSSNMHTSNSVVNFTQFGYTYDQLDPSKSRNQLRQDATRLINTMYSNGQTMNRRGLKLKKRGQDTYTRFFAHVEVDVTQVEKPCTVNVYLDGKQIDQHIVMMQPAEGNSHGGYSMDSAIEAGIKDGQEVDDVLKSVLGKLTVAVVKHDGTNLPVDKIPSLKLNIQHVEVTPADSDCSLPTYDNSKMTAAKIVQQPCGCEGTGSSSGNAPASTAPASTAPASTGDSSSDYAAPTSAAPAATGDSSGETPGDYATTSSAPDATGDSSGAAPTDSGSGYDSGSGSGSGYAGGSIGGSVGGSLGGAIDGSVGGNIGGDVSGIINGALGGHGGFGVGYGRKRHARG